MNVQELIDTLDSMICAGKISIDDKVSVLIPGAGYEGMTVVSPVESIDRDTDNYGDYGVVITSETML